MIYPEFAQPLWLLAGLAATVLVGLFLYLTEKRAKKRLVRFIAPELVERLAQTRSNPRIWTRHGLLLLGILLLFITLARPQMGADWLRQETTGIDIMIALDTSRSMLAEDITPNRLERSKLAILDLLDSVRGDRIGLIAFAGNAFLQCPLTLDYQAFRQTLAALDTESIPVGGTDVASAIEEAEAYFEKTDNDRLLILITDGEDLGEAGLARAVRAGQNGTRIITVGVGSTQGELIPIKAADGQRDFLRDEQGNPVSTSLDAETLIKIAEATGGVYSSLGPTGSGLLDAYSFSLQQADSSERNEMLQRVPIERFQWPLLLAFVLLVLQPLISNRRKLMEGGSRLLILLCALIATAGTAPSAHASARDAVKAYDEERYEEAVSLYQEAAREDPDNLKFAFNLGVAAYKSDQFELAISEFDRVVRNDNGRLKTKAFYNMGNSRVAAGLGAIEETPALTRDYWNKALLDYENALALDPDYTSAKANAEALKTTIANHTFNLKTAALPEIGGTVSPSQTSFYGVATPIKAEAAEGWEFAGWEGENIAQPEAASTTIALKEDQSIIGRFAKIWNLEVTVNDAQAGTAGESGTFREATPVPLKAEAEDYFAFSKWLVEGNGKLADENAPETEITLSGDATATATFVPAFKLSVTVDPEIGGKAGPSGFFEEYSVVPLQAEPREGFEWVSWNGFGIKDADELQTTIALTSDRIAIAQMKRIWNLVIIPQPEEAGTTTGAGNHPIGSQVDISATANEGYRFERWEGPAIADPTGAETSVTVQSSTHTLFAIFAQEDQEDQNQQDQEQQDQNQQQNQDQQQDNSSQNQDQQQEQNQSQENEQESQSSEESQEQEQAEQSDSEEEQEEQETAAEEEEKAGDEQEQQAEGEPEASQAAPQVPLNTPQMSRDEARQLLNALSEDERFLPAGQANEEIESRNLPKSGKDW